MKPAIEWIQKTNPAQGFAVMADRDTNQAAEGLRRALGRHARRHVEAYIRHLEHEGEKAEAAHWRMVAEAIGQAGDDDDTTPPAPKPDAESRSRPTAGPAPLRAKERA